MTAAAGIGLAIIAMLSWGVGDFLIQKSTRKLGDWETLFFITLFGTLILLPFVYKQIPALFSNTQNTLMVLITAGLFLSCAAMLLLEGYRIGKLSVIEPMLSLEIPSAALLSFLILKDYVSTTQLILIGVLVIGLMLVSFREKVIKKDFLLERGVLIVVGGSVLMGVADFLLGWGARIADPLMANFVINLVMVLLSGLYIWKHGGMKHTFKSIRESRGLVLVMSVSDNIGWIAYAFAMSVAPIAVVTGLSESSTLIAVTLGFTMNREKVQRHQKIGLVIALVAAITLALITAS